MMEPWEIENQKVQRCLDNGELKQTFKLRNFIDGTFEAHDGDFITSCNPRNGSDLAQIPCTGLNDVSKAVESATKAFSSWSSTSRTIRSRYLQSIASLIAERKEQFALWESIDQGKTLARARIEVDRAISNFNYFSTFILHEQTAARWTDDNVLTYEHRSPVGCFALISPWNMPIYLLTWKIAPCIAFGCTAVAKPSEVTSMTAYLLAKVLQDVQLPRGVVNIIFGDGPVTGSSLIKHPLVKGVSFTGGTKTGIQIRKNTVEDIGKHISLELGGKNPTLIFDDVDLEQAVAIAAKAGFENQGEICLCGSRIYVQKTIFQPFMEKFVAHVKNSYTLKSTVGPVVSLEHYQKVRKYLLHASEFSDSYKLGMIPPEYPQHGYWIEPAVLTAPQSSVIMKEEIFGPVVTVATFDTEEDAIAFANDTEYGLASILLTKDGARMRRVGERIDAGLVWVNSWLVRELGTPFGGMKASGTSREGGAYSQDVFTNLRTIHIPQ